MLFWPMSPIEGEWSPLTQGLQDIFVILTSSCARVMPRRKGYNQLSTGGRGRRDDEANGLIDSYEEEY